VKQYYDFARRWIAAEVARERHLKSRHYARAMRAASSALVGRLGMAMTAEWRER
jgi:RNase P/RNase MRP subunit POP5